MKNRSACRILMGKLEGKRPLGKPRYRWEDKVKYAFGYRWTASVPKRRKIGMQF
jgi:hypothetical protein